MNIRDFLSRHKYLDYFQRCLRYSKRADFVESVLSIYRDPNLLHFECRGGEWQDENFYDVYIDYPSKGFFALLLQTLDALRYADRFYLTPIVTWSDRCLYKEDHPIDGESNPFAYYFEPLNGFDRESLKSATRVLRYIDCQRSIDREHAFGVVSKTIVENNCYDAYISANAEVYGKYIRIRRPVMERIEQSMKRLTFDENQRILGVHVRATDFNKGYINHAVAVSENEYIQTALEAQKAHNFDRIFLATDDVTVTENFRQVFGDRLIFCEDVFRSTDGNAVHFSQSQRANHKYELGVEVIRDMYFLSRCCGLIGGFSNVCIAAQIARLSSGQGYEYLKVMDKGFNSTGITTYQDHYKK